MRSKILFAVIMLFVFLLCVSASAEDVMSITIDEKIVCDRTDEVRVAVTLDGNPGYTYLKLDLAYDEETFTLDRVENGELIEEFYSGAYFIWSGEEDCTENGVLAEFVFKVAEDAFYDEYSIEVVCIECSNYDEEDVATVCNNANVIVRYYRGDVDNDGYLTIRDAALILQYIAGWDVTVNEAAADADGNGTVNIRDAALILQYIAGWDVTLG